MNLSEDTATDADDWQGGGQREDTGVATVYIVATGG